MWAFCFIGKVRYIRFIKGDYTYPCDPDESKEYKDVLPVGPTSMYTSVILIPLLNSEGRPA